jgi:hypothetical protein
VAATDCVSVAGVFDTRLPAPSKGHFLPRSNVAGACTVGGGPSHGGSCPCGLVHHVELDGFPGRLAESPIRFAQRSMYGLSPMSYRRTFLTFTFFALLLALFWVALAFNLFGFDA